MAAIPIYDKNLFKASSPEPRAPWDWIFAQIIGDGRSTKVVKVMIVHWRLPFLRQGQVYFLMHLYGKNVENFKQLLWSLRANVAQISCVASLGQGNESCLNGCGSLTMPIYGKNFQNLLLQDRGCLGAEFLHKLSGTGSTKVAQMMVVQLRLTFLRRGQVCFRMHLYRPRTFVWKK